MAGIAGGAFTVGRCALSSAVGVNCCAGTSAGSSGADGTDAGGEHSACAMTAAALDGASTCPSKGSDRNRRAQLIGTGAEATPGSSKLPSSGSEATAESVGEVLGVAMNLRKADVDGPRTTPSWISWTTLVVSTTLQHLSRCSGEIWWA